jgi:micrococcal nuclease
VIKKTFIYTLLALALFTLPACAEDHKSQRQGVITWIYDGDTLEIEPHGKVRLLGIDTPERKASNRDRYLLQRDVPAKKQREIYLEAKRYNIENFKGKEVTLEFDGNERDRHDRLLAYVHLPDGRILNQVLLEKGLAVVYQRFSFKRKEEFIAAEAQARQLRKGLWEGK